MTKKLFNVLLVGLLLAFVTICNIVPRESMLAAAPRSSQWPNVRAAYLKLHPRCESCGGKEGLQVHHVIPFAAGGADDEDGDGITNELDADNLITLCTGDTMNCHLWIGHAGNFRSWNPTVREDAKRFREMIANRRPNR